MIFAIGSQNKAKVQALKEVLKELKHFSDAEVTSCSVSSNVSEQPMTLEETIQGAKNRAHGAFNQTNAQYGCGIESGLVKAQGTETGFLHFSICAIYDGNKYAIGSSTGFEIPPATLKHILDHQLDLSQACLASKISSNENIGQEEGIVGILTDGRLNRLKYSKESIYSAIFQVIHNNWYSDHSKISL